MENLNQIIGYTQSGKPIYQPIQSGQQTKHSNKKSTKANYAHFSIQDHKDAVDITKSFHEKCKDVLREMIGKEMKIELYKPTKETRIEGWGQSVSAFRKDQCEGKQMYDLVAKHTILNSFIYGSLNMEWYHENAGIQKQKLVDKVAQFTSDK